MVLKSLKKAMVITSEVEMSELLWEMGESRGQKAQRRRLKWIYHVKPENLLNGPVPWEGPEECSEERSTGITEKLHSGCPCTFRTGFLVSK